MSVSRSKVRGILQDAIQDREGLVDAYAHISDDPAVTIAQQEISDCQGLLERMKADHHRYSDADRAVIVRACRRALRWRESYLDAVAGIRDVEMVRTAEADVRTVRNALARFDPNPEPPKQYGFVTLDEIQKGAGTHVVETSADGVTTRMISEDGAALGRAVKDADGIIRAYLADGTIANEEFDDLYAAQFWVLERTSRNALFAGRTLGT